MRTLDLNQPISAHKLNESMFKKFGVRVNLENYSREELENYRNLLRTQLFQHEAKSNFNDLLTNETYQKNKQIVTILNQKIKEIVGESKLAEGAKVDRMVKHIEKSERKAGKSKKDAENIAWATANKRGMLDNKNKKKKAEEGTEDKTMKKTTEALKGKQSKLDVDHDGKLEKSDFKKLRAGKKAESMEEGWDDMVAAAKDKAKEKGTGKFDKKKTSTGTVYTRKSSTFDNGTEDKPKEKKKTKESQHRRNVKLVNESIVRWLAEDEEGKAKSITAGTDMVNDFTSWMTRVGQYQTKSMIELADEIRANFGQEEAERFKSAVQPALDAALQALTAAREEISNSVAVLAGEAPAENPMGMEPGMDDMGGEMPGEEGGMDDMGGDEFAGADAAAGGMETPGREMRESRKLFARKLAESHNIMRTLAK